MTEFEMRNFRNFPMEKTSYDLKLEILEELDHLEGLELMKANDGFRSIYLKDPWRIIGRHVHSIAFDFDTFKILKLGQPSRLSDLSFPSPLLKKIKSCEEFLDRRQIKHMTQQAIDTSRKMLSNLDSIGKLMNHTFDLESFKECFSNFKGHITDYIGMDLEWLSREGNDSNLSLVSKVFETQIGKCNEVSIVCCIDQFSVISHFFLKTRVKIVYYLFNAYEPVSATDLEMVMRWIVCDGIPSQNREAEILMRIWGHSAYDSFDNFLSTFPGMQKMSNENNIRSYWRKIDDDRNCMYQLKLKAQGTEIFAKYVPSPAP